MGFTVLPPPPAAVKYNIRVLEITRLQNCKFQKAYMQYKLWSFAQIVSKPRVMLNTAIWREQSSVDTHLSSWVRRHGISYRAPFATLHPWTVSRRPWKHFFLTNILLYYYYMT